MGKDCLYPLEQFEENGRNLPNLIHMGLDVFLNSVLYSFCSIEAEGSRIGIIRKRK